jgi:hypothetical protein
MDSGWITHVFWNMSQIGHTATTNASFSVSSRTIAQPRWRSRRITGSPLLKHVAPWRPLRLRLPPRNPLDYTMA